MEELGLSLFLLLACSYFAPTLAYAALVALNALAAYHYWRFRFGGRGRGANYWLHRGVAPPHGWRRAVFPFGNTAANSLWVKLGRAAPGDAVRRQYGDAVAAASDGAARANAGGSAMSQKKAFGTYDFGLRAAPVLHLADPALARRMLVDKFDSFSERRPKYPPEAAGDTRFSNIRSCYPSHRI